MSKKTKIITLVAILVVIVLLGWTYTQTMKDKAGVSEEAAMGAVYRASDEPGDIKSKTDASDRAMVEDSATIDAQLKSLSGDSARADQSMNDKPIAQE